MQENQTRRDFPWKALIVAASIVIVSAFALLAYLRTEHGAETVGKKGLELGEKGIALGEKVVDKLPEIARNFKTGNITTTFRESIPNVVSTKGNMLELAKSEGDEDFRDEHETRILGAYFGTTEAEIQAHVTFRYHLLLSDTWRLASSNQVCIVLAPKIRPTLPPAIDTASMQKRAENGWARFDKNDRLEELEKSMTAELVKRATDANHSGLAREACRQSVATFVKTWLMREDYWRTDRFRVITVVFPDEVTVSSDEQLSEIDSKPTMTLESK